MVIFLKLPIFVNAKIRYNRKMITEKDILRALRAGKIQLPPLGLRLLDSQPNKASSGMGNQSDAQIEITSGRRSWKFLVECKADSSPKALQTAISSAQSFSTPGKHNPLIILPYLSSEAIARLEELSVSGLDLCGNGIVTVGKELFVVRSGQPNRFPRSEPIRNVYRGTSSYVGRVLMSQQVFNAVGEIVSLIDIRGGTISFGTVSKVLKTLEGDLIVQRNDDKIKLIQPDKLLNELATNFRPPRVVERFIGKIAIEERIVPKILSEAAPRVHSELVIAGAASAGRYSVLAREPVVAAYCNTSPKEILLAAGVAFEETDRFPNIDLIYTDDKLPFFEPVEQDGVKYTSALQVYLELTSGDKRQKESAEQVRKVLMDWAKEPQTKWTPIHSSRR